MLDDTVVARHRLTAKEVASNKSGNIRCMGDDLIIGGTEMRPASCPNEVPYLRLPTIRKPEYLFQLPDGQYVYVSADKYNYSYESFQLYIGTGDTMREIPVRNVDRYRDGGTTVIRTDELVLFSPTPFKQDKAATWGDQKLTKLDSQQFNITETGNGVTLKAKS